MQLFNNGIVGYCDATVITNQPTLSSNPVQYGNYVCLVFTDTCKYISISMVSNFRKYNN